MFDSASNMVNLDSRVVCRGMLVFVFLSPLFIDDVEVGVIGAYWE